MEGYFLLIFGTISNMSNKALWACATNRKIMVAVVAIIRLVRITLR